MLANKYDYYDCLANPTAVVKENIRKFKIRDLLSQTYKVNQGLLFLSHSLDLSSL